MSDQPRQIVHTAVTVGATTVELAAANANRTYLLLVNDSDAAIYVKFGVAAVLNEGIRINANGGSLEVSPRNGNLDIRAVNGIASAASKEMLIAQA